MAKPVKKEINFWQFLRDVLIHSMNKGQFGLAIFGGVIAVIVWRMPAADVSKLAFDVLQKLQNGYLTGYALSVLSLFGWLMHIRVQRKMLTGEVDRVSEEKSKYQHKTLGNSAESSES